MDSEHFKRNQKLKIDATYRGMVSHCFSLISNGGGKGERKINGSKLKTVQRKMTEITNGRQNKQLLGIHHSSLWDSFCIRCNSFALLYLKIHRNKTKFVSYLSSEMKKLVVDDNDKKRHRAKGKKNCGFNFYLVFIRGKTISTSINIEY